MNGQILISKLAESEATQAIDLQWMVMACDPNSVERETCDELPVSPLDGAGGCTPPSPAPGQARREGAVPGDLPPGTSRQERRACESGVWRRWC